MTRHPQVTAVLDKFPMFEHLGCGSSEYTTAIARIGYRHPAVWGKTRPAFYSDQEFGADVEIDLQHTAIRGAFIVRMSCRSVYVDHTGIPPYDNRPTFDTLESAAVWLMLHGGIAS